MDIQKIDKKTLKAALKEILAEDFSSLKSILKEILLEINEEAKADSKDNEDKTIEDIIDLNMKKYDAELKALA